MNNQLEETIFSDLAQMEEMLTSDISGDHARMMISYFADVATVSEGMSVSAPSEAERHLAGRLVEGFRACQRIIRHVWETQHGTVLAI